jgi:hypothetical protein
MGRSTTPTYRLEITGHTGNFTITNSAWHVQSRYGIPGDGRPSTDNLDRYVTAFEKSLRTGGSNAHLGIFLITSCRIIRQSTGKVVAEWKRSEQRKNEPMFQVI